VHALDEMIKYSDSDRFLSILPLNHTLEITGGLIAPLFAGACITYSDSLKPDKLIALMKETKTTVMISVPLVLKMIHDAIMKKAGKLSPPKRKMFIFLLKTSRFMMSINRGIGKVFFRSVHDEFGGHLRGFITGGAPLNKEVEININALGFRVLQGYGLTETAPVISVNTLKYNRIGSAGKAIPGVEVKVVKKSKTDPTGEIATKGPHMMRGYYKDPDKTKEVIKDGWLHTGDIGHVDRRGYLYISGRERNLIVLGSGKKVFPEEVEAVIEKSPYIKEICVLARISTKGRKAGTEEVYAVIVPELDVFTPAEKYDKLSIKERLKQELSRLSKELASYKRISAFEVWEDELPKTASRKIKRKAVEEKVGITGRMIK